MPCMEPRTLPAFLSLSILSAMLNASGFNWITAFIAGPFLSIASMRSKYNCVIDLDVYSPLCIFFCSSSIVISFKTKSPGEVTGSFSFSPVCFLSAELLQEAIPTDAIANDANELFLIKFLLCIVERFIYVIVVSLFFQCSNFCRVH